jgi:hypothetical protein
MVDLKKIDFIDELNRIKFMQLRASVQGVQKLYSEIQKRKQGKFSRLRNLINVLTGYVRGRSSNKTQGEILLFTVF